MLFVEPFVLDYFVFVWSSLDVYICLIVVCAGRARASMQRLLKCCLRAAFSSVVLELPAKGTHAPRTVCGYGALVRRFTARRFSVAAGDTLRTCSGGLRSDPTLSEREELMRIFTERAKPSFAAFGELSGADHFRTRPKAVSNSR
jgi:hypothetical protein